MSKLKLLLLGGIFTLVGIFNFSSAENYGGMSFTCSVGGDIEGYNQCSDDYIYFDPYIEGDYILSASSSISLNATVQVTNGTFGDENGGILSSVAFPGTYNLTCLEGGCQSINVYSYSSIVGSTPALITFSISSNGGEGGADSGTIIPGGFTPFVSVVSSLGSVVTQFIPLVVYISIGFIIAVLGFYAIKWLCNWFLVKINSVFKSKRG